MVTPSEGMGMVYVSVASSPVTSMPSTKLRMSALRSGNVPLLQERPEVRHVPLDLLCGRKLHAALLQLTGGVLSRSLKLLLTVPQREDAGRRTSNVSSLVSRAS